MHDAEHARAKDDSCHDESGRTCSPTPRVAPTESAATNAGDVYGMLAHQPGVKHPERYVLGKPHADRAKQFKPFAALRGYEELIAQVMQEADEPHDFFDVEEAC